jgi:formiminoglutamate deiminase
MRVTWHADLAWVGDGPRRDVLIEVEDGRFTAVTAQTAAPAGATRLRGLTLPGLANAHSHAFHRALRGRTQSRAGSAGTAGLASSLLAPGDAGDFWTWRERMYAVAAHLDPDSYLELATAVYAEMALAGITCVGEFHYLHHGPDGTPYADPNAMGEALVEAAARAGIRITLLDTLYLAASVDGAPLSGPQRRFGDRDVDAWADRVATLKPPEHARVGAAVHSVRAVPAEALADVKRHAADRPLHVHLSEQPAENEACLARHGRTPTRLLDAYGLLGPRTTAVHATHLTPDDIALLGRTGTAICLCPTTERDLADGIGPGGALAAAGSPLCVGSDSHAVVDLFEEARGVELHERLATLRRGHFSAAELVRAATVAGHVACGWSDAGAIAPGARADLVAVRLDSPRTAGVEPAAVIFAATAADVTDVVVDGRPVVRDGRHLTVCLPGVLA